jgi:hypothetical protein
MQSVLRRGAWMRDLRAIGAVILLVVLARARSLRAGRRTNPTVALKWVK